MRFSYVKYDDASVKQQNDLKIAFEALEHLANHLMDGRAKALVMTKLEEAYMWTGKAIRDAQYHRNQNTQEQPERNNE